MVVGTSNFMPELKWSQLFHSSKQLAHHKSGKLSHDGAGINCLTKISWPEFNVSRNELVRALANPMFDQDLIYFHIIRVDKNIASY